MSRPSVRVPGGLGLRDSRRQHLGITGRHSTQGRDAKRSGSTRSTPGRSLSASARADASACEIVGLSASTRRSSSSRSCPRSSPISSRKCQSSASTASRNSGVETRRLFVRQPKPDLAMHGVGRRLPIVPEAFRAHPRPLVAPPLRRQLPRKLTELDPTTTQLAPVCDDVGLREPAGKLLEVSRIGVDLSHPGWSFRHLRNLFHAPSKVVHFKTLCTVVHYARLRCALPLQRP